MSIVLLNLFPPLVVNKGIRYNTWVITRNKNSNSGALFSVRAMKGFLVWRVRYSIKRVWGKRYRETAF